jgi:UbiD family decarboxylase
MTPAGTYTSLGAFIDAVDQRGDVKRIDGADWNLEVGCLTELSAETDGPLLLFDTFSGFPAGYRVASNVINTPRRLAIALGLAPDKHPIDLVRLLRERRNRLKPIPPVEVPDGPALECRQPEGSIDLKAFPVPKWHEHDGGRYIGTGDLVVLRDPDSDWVNCGVYRVCLQGSDRLSLWIIGAKHGRIIAERYWQRGQAAPVAVVLGCDPATWTAGYSATPAGSSEYAYAGALHGEPVRVVRGRCTGLPFPAEADIVVEGEIPPPSVETVEEGPFGEWPGYYTHQGRECVIRVKAIWHRPKPILLGIPPLRPFSATGSHTTYGIPLSAVELWDHLERGGITDVCGVWGHNNTLLFVISLKQRYAGHAKQALLSAAGFRSGASMYSMAVTVDEDIDPTNLQEVVWAICTRADPASAIEIVQGAWASNLDPRLSPARKASGETTVGRMLIDACRPFHWKDDFPRTNVFSRELRQATAAKWRHVLDNLTAEDRPSARASG